MSLIGTTISHYKIIEKMGEGGMGLVYRARDTRLHRDVSLKFLPESLARDEVTKERFLLEARAASALDHQNICTVHEIDESDNGHLFIVMACYEGDSLRNRITRGKPDLPEALDIVMQAAEGLARAHSHGIVHRDVKPENLMLTSDSVVKIIDFGLAKSGQVSHLTQVGATVGTISYMSPEQARGEQVDHRTDIWALGVIFYELVMGELPFKGEYEQAVIYSILNEAPLPPGELEPDLPEYVSQVIQRALAKDPADRYERMDDLLHDLKQARSAEHQLSHGRSVLPAQPVRTRSRVFAGLATLVAIAVLFVVIMQALQRSEGSAISMAIMPFRVESENAGWRWLGSGISDMLTTSLEKLPTVNIIGARQQLRIMQSLNLHGINLDNEQALAIARKARAARLLSGNVRIEGNQVHLRMEILDSTTGDEVEALPEMQGALDDISALTQQAAERIRTSLHLEQFAGAKSERLQPTNSLEAQRNYIEGLNAAYDMQYMMSIQKLSRAVALDSSFVRAYYFLAWQYQLIGERAKAKAVLEKGKPFIARLSEKERLWYLCNEAGIDHRWHDYAKYLEELCRHDPTNPESHFLYGWVQYHKFRMPSAGAVHMQKAISLDSSYGYAYNTLAFARMVQGHKQEAIETINTAIRLFPTDLNYKDSKAEVSLLTGDYAETRRLSEYILQLKPDFQLSPKLLARAHFAEGKIERGLEILREFTRRSHIKSSIADGLIWQAIGQWQLDSLDASRALVDSARSVKPGSFVALWLSGVLAAEKRDLQSATEAYEALEKALQTEEGLDKHWYKHHLAGSISLVRGEPREAISSFEKAISLFPPDRPFFIVALAEAQLQSGQRQKAIDTLKDALSYNPRYAMAWLGLARVYEAQGDRRNAREAYEQLLEIWANADLALVAKHIPNS